MPNILDPNYPIEYREWSVVFFGKKFVVNPHVLIPRLDTEGLVRRARTLIRNTGIQAVVDIGTGSGIIWVSLADLVEKSIFLDISEGALTTARSNFLEYFPEENGVFLLSDLLLRKEMQELDTTNTLFVANLPYIKNADWGNMSADTHFEPELALFGWEVTGFEMYIRLFDQIQELLKNPKNKKILLLIEFGFDQRNIAEEIIKKYHWNYGFFADYGGIERFCEIECV